MSRLASIWNFVRRHKYLVVLVSFGVLIVFIDENNLILRLRQSQEITALKNEIEHYHNEYIKSTKKLNELQSDPATIEQVAREKYFMKKPNEDIFIFEE